MPSIDLASVREEIELDREWREAELRLLRNRIAYIDDESQQKTARKALVVMLYAHFEGLCRSLLNIYVKELNSLGILAADAHSALVASAHSDVFFALRDPQRKCDLFRRSLPDDTALHRYARDREFVENAADFGVRPIVLDPDKIIDTEENLKPIVLKKILFRLGLSPNLVDPWTSTIQELLKRRNDVAHGTARQGIDARDYNELEQAVWGVVDGLVSVVSSAVIEQQYLSPTSSRAVV